MKDRATVLCIRDGRILLVARQRSRWALPGGRIKRAEAPIDAARRELREETGLLAASMSYYFEFRGLSTSHHIFTAGVPAAATPQPMNEIVRCEWFLASEIFTLSASIPTRGIVELFVRQLPSLEQLTTMPLEPPQDTCAKTDVIRLHEPPV